MAQTKQTQRKQPNKQGSPAKFPKKGKPTSKAAKHLQAASDDNSDDNNNTVQNTIRAGRRHRVYGGKARIYKRPAGLKRKYRPGVGALHEICHYQREHGTICSKIACARLFREICEKEKTGLRWQASAIMALQEGFEDYLVELFRDTVLAPRKKENCHAEGHTPRVSTTSRNRSVCGVCQLEGFEEEE